MGSTDDDTRSERQLICDLNDLNNCQFVCHLLSDLCFGGRLSPLCSGGRECLNICLAEALSRLHFPG